MKRLRIWLSGLSLIQQFISVGFFVILFFLLFSFTLLSRNVDNFINRQMFIYLESSQNEYFMYSDTYSEAVDKNVSHYIYDRSSGVFLGNVPEDVVSLMNGLDLQKVAETSYGIAGKGKTSRIYALHPYEKSSLLLVSLISESYRRSFKAMLSEGVIDVTLLVVLLLFSFMIIWVFTLIRPLNQIKHYIDKIRNGEKNPELRVQRADEIGEVAEALVDMQQELQQQKQIRDEMIQNISHDLKTPIATIKSYSESIKDGIYPYGTLEKSVDVISEHADRLEKKVYSLITFNKLGYLDDSAPEGNTVPMVQVIHKAIVACKVLRTDIEIETDLKDVCFHGEEDPWRIVVENLLDNALRYAKSVIRIKLRKGRLEVYNDGEQLDQEYLQKMFTPYEKGTKGNFGLGLSIVKRVCDTYGYSVTGGNTADGVLFRIISLKKEKN